MYPWGYYGPPPYGYLRPVIFAPPVVREVVVVEERAPAEVRHVIEDKHRSDREVRHVIENGRDRNFRLAIEHGRCQDRGGRSPRCGRSPSPRRKGGRDNSPSRHDRSPHPEKRRQKSRDSYNDRDHDHNRQSAKPKPKPVRKSPHGRGEQRGYGLSPPPRPDHGRKHQDRSSKGKHYESRSPSPRKKESSNRKPEQRSAKSRYDALSSSYQYAQEDSRKLAPTYTQTKYAKKTQPAVEPVTEKVKQFDPYNALGLRSDCSAFDIEATKKLLLRKFHPDKQYHASDYEKEHAAKRAAEVNRAWDILGDSARRSVYDRWGYTEEWKIQEQLERDGRNEKNSWAVGRPRRNSDE